MMKPAILHNKPAFDHVPTPAWLAQHFDARPFHDLYPLRCESIVLPVLPPDSVKLWGNPGYSRKAEAAEECIALHERGYYVELLVPMESSTQFAKRLLQYGVERMYFDRRPFPTCRGVELLILTGGSQDGGSGQSTLPS